MRSITFKLIIGFLVIGIISIFLMVLLARWNTKQEFTRFVSDRAQNDITVTLSDYYRAHGSWDKAGDLFPSPSSQSQNNPDQHPLPPFTLTNESGIVLLSRDRYPIGAPIASSELERGFPIAVDGKIVGILFIGRAPFAGDSRAQEFIQRNNLLMMYSAIGATLVALLLGVILSRTLTRPIRELTLATHAISEGNLSQQVPVRSRDELGELARSFNKMSADLSRSVNARRQMTADIAHELRTPLSLILGHAEAVHDGVLPPSPENFEIIREEAGRLEHLVDDLRTLSLADAGELSIEKQPVDMKKLLQDISSVYQHRIGQNNVALELNLPAELPSIQADANRMTQVVTNILDNAIRYTPENGKVILSANQAEGGVQISIQDSGPGIKEEDVGRIFDRFYRLDVSRNRGEGGSGLGLAIARSIVQAHGGRIWAESKPGQGLTIFILIP